MKQVVAERRDIAFYIKFLPLEFHKDAYWKAKSIVCNKSLKMLEDNFEKREIPKTECANDEIDNSVKLAKSLGIGGTPSLILPDGRLKIGALPKAELLALLTGRNSMKRRKGFTLVELVIVVFMLALISAIGGLALHNYTLNRNLRTAARDIASDFAIFKERAISDNVTYRIAFDTALPGSYTIQSVVNPGPVVTNLTTKSPTSFGSDIKIISAGALQTVDFSPRGTVSPLGNAVLDGIVLQNSRNSRATITVNLTGRTYVTFNIL